MIKTQVSNSNILFKNVAISLNSCYSDSQTRKVFQGDKNETTQNLHVRTKKLASLGHRGKPLKHKGRDTRRGWSTAGQDRIRPRQPPSGTQGREPKGKPGPECRVRPGAEFSMEPERTGARRSGSSGTNGGHRAAAHFSPGAFKLGEVPPHGGTGQAGFFEAGREGGARPRRPGRESERGPAPGP